MLTHLTNRPRVMIMAASTRRNSINKALANEIAAQVGTPESIDLIDLRDFPLPLYDGDLEDRDGVPSTARHLADHVASAEVLIIVTPEYNGSFTPLLKNTVDWITRVDAAAFAHLHVLVSSASPGRGGGSNGVSMVRTWLENMGVHVAERTLSVGEASLGSDGGLVGLDETEMTRFVQQAVPDRSAA